MAPSARKTGRSRSPRRRNGTPPRWPTVRQAGWICAAGVEFTHAERLGHVVIGAVFERVDLAVFGAVPGQHDDGHLAPDPDALADDQAIQVRQTQVEHDHVRCAQRGLADSLLPGFRGTDGMAEGLQPDAADAEQAWVIVNDENLRQPSAPQAPTRSSWARRVSKRPRAA